LFISRFRDTLTFNFREIVSEKEGEGTARSQKIFKFNEFSLNGVIWTQKLDTKFIALEINREMRLLMLTSPEILDILC